LPRRQTQVALPLPAQRSQGCEVRASSPLLGHRAKLQVPVCLLVDYQAGGEQDSKIFSVKQG